jgi:hypothetical protein
VVHRLVRIAPIKAAKIAAVLYGLMSLLFLPFIVLSRAWATNPPSLAFFLLVIPGYACLGFVTTAIVASLYNVAARYVGGIEVTLASDERPPGQG